MEQSIIASPLLLSPELESRKSQMGMSDKGMDMATYFMRDKIYSNKILAVVREYICNALDEHIRYNVSEPVKVTLDYDKFTVRDFAKGLSEYDVRNIFGMYFESTKAKTNSQIGGFGIGSKAGHCYTDTFYVNSFYEGVNTMYACVLGAGSKGIPVGQIIKVSEQPTTETGIEISLEVKENDLYRFSSTTGRFVDNCYPSNIIFDNIFTSEVIVPSVPVKEYHTGSYIIRLIKNNTSFATYGNGSGDICYSMGGVNYNTISFDRLNLNIKKIKIKTDHRIVVSIPIGTMSIPISRESFEDTPSNKIILKEIETAIGNLVNEDFASYNNTSIQTLLDTMSESRINGEWFCGYKTNIFKSIYSVISNFAFTNSDWANAEKTSDGKYIVALIPDKRSYQHWFNKFSIHAKSQNKIYFTLREDFLDDKNLDKELLEKHFFFKNCKSVVFNWPKSSFTASDERYIVRIAGITGKVDYKKRLSALELHNMMAAKIEIPLAETLEEAKEQMRNIEFDSFEKLRYFTIANGNSFNHNFHCSCSTIVESMVDIGWFLHNSVEYHNVFRKVQSVVTEIHQKTLKIKAVEFGFVNSIIRKKWKELVINNPSNSQRIVNKFDKLFYEDSLRGKLLSRIRHGSVEFSRSELRKILQMK